jgi:alkylation response protein AidB-like acyl-CoA dehydrogenase
MTASLETVLKGVQALSAEFAEQRRERQARRGLDRSDFARLADAGFLLSGVPASEGGLWHDVAQSTRPVTELLRTLAHGDSSVALVSAMHPTVLAFWLAMPSASEPFQLAWQEQRARIVASVREGALWGTLSSEPGSGGDITRTRAIAKRDHDGAGYRLSGEKQFGSGSGVTAFMMTVAVPEGEDQADLFYMDVRDVPWDGSTGLRLVAPWDGHGMTATQSHAFHFADFPAVRSAWPGNFFALGAVVQPYIRCCFTAVIVGIVEVALATAHEQLRKRRGSLRAYEQVEWARAELEGWLIQQAFEGMLRAVERGEDIASATVRGKVAIAELAESALARMCRVVGGGTYARSSPLGNWAQDVRALGFLRPPWGLAFDSLIPDSS